MNITMSFLIRPRYLVFSGRNIVHLTRTIHSSTLMNGFFVGSKREKELFPSFRGELWCNRDAIHSNSVALYEKRPRNLSLCKKCMRSVQSELLGFIRENLIYYITRGLENSGITLGYYNRGVALTKDVRVENGKLFGSVTFIFKDKYLSNTMRKVEVSLLDCDDWRWKVSGTNEEVGECLAAEIVKEIHKRDEQHKEQQEIWKDNSEELFFFEWGLEA